MCWRSAVSHKHQCKISGFSSCERQLAKRESASSLASPAYQCIPGTTNSRQPVIQSRVTGFAGERDRVSIAPDKPQRFVRILGSQQNSSYLREYFCKSFSGAQGVIIGCATAFCGTSCAGCYFSWIWRNAHRLRWQDWYVGRFTCWWHRVGKRRCRPAPVAQIQQKPSNWLLFCKSEWIKFLTDHSCIKCSGDPHPPFWEKVGKAGRTAFIHSPEGEQRPQCWWYFCALKPGNPSLR